MPGLPHTSPIVFPFIRAGVIAGKFRAYIDADRGTSLSSHCCASAFTPTFYRRILTSRTTLSTTWTVSRTFPSYRSVGCTWRSFCVCAGLARLV